MTDWLVYVSARGPGGWNDPDMINVKNPPALTLGENRVYFGLWSIMKVCVAACRNGTVTGE